jgi:hypothetical protein
MEQQTQRRRRRRERARTWSSLGQLGRVPSEYEIVTHGMNHTAHPDGRLPLEMGESRQGNQWLKKHRNQVALQVENWDAFRDPDQLTYRSYNRMQDDNETFVDKVLADLGDAEGTHSDAWLEALGRVLTVQRYPVHGLQMLATYTAQMAPTSYVVNCASFQAFDELRRVQRIAYRTKELALAHPDRGFGDRERETWETDPGWQGVRKAIEKALVAYDWDESFVAANLVIKPLYDELFLHELAVAARERDDDVDGLVLENLHQDGLRSRRWSAALARFCIEERAENREVLAKHVEAWRPLAEELTTTASTMLSEATGVAAEELAERSLAMLRALHAEAGLEG